MPSRIKPVGVHIATVTATAGLAPRALASAIPVTSDTASFFFMYFLPGLTGNPR